MNQVVARTFIREIAGKEVGIELSTAELEIDTTDLVREASRVAARMGLVSDLLASVIESADVADARYRHWRGQEAMALGKLSEHASKAAIEAKREFVKHKAECAALGIRIQGQPPGGDIGWLEKFWKALDVKSRMIDSLLRRDRTNEQRAGNIGREPLPERRL